MTASGMQDMLIGTVKLVERVGATGFDVGYMNDDEGVMVGDAEWYAACHWRGTRVTVEKRRSPDEACLALALRLLAGATCKCTRPVVLSDSESGCRWRLLGDTWTPSCDAAPLTVTGVRGDTGQIRDALGRRLEEGFDRTPERQGRRGQFQKRGRKRRS